ncbi:MAG: hypothetical protein FRX49_03762 [Trebouxia sp. A1-2]|nr:MAG: hypothetical protein FRX49_03762 [Trebouxia sp. A1-2]
MEETLYEKAKSLVSCDRGYGNCSTVFCEADSSLPAQEEYLSVDTLDERMKDITQDMCGSVRNRPCTRPSSTKSSQVLADKGSSCQTGSSRYSSVTKQASGDDSESGLMTQSDTEMRCQTDPENTQIGSQTDSGHPESLSHTSSKHSRCSDHAHDEVTSHMRGTATAICVQSAPPLPWSEVIALGYIPEDWLSPKLLRREQIVKSQCSRLQLLHHAFHCSESQETCHYGRGCVATKHLWQNMLACDTADCDPRGHGLFRW